MAVPKKRVSRSRRDMRRYSCAYKTDPVAFTSASDGNLVRTHTVTIETLGAYIEARNARRKETRAKTKAAKA